MCNVSSLYHYTSIEALYEIIRSVCKEKITLRGTHVSYLNDLTEGQLLAQALVKFGVPKNIISNLLCCSGYPFIISLSEKSDDLNMWRCYAAEGKGVAIELEVPVLYKTFGDELKKCEYMSPEDVKNKIASDYGHEKFDNKKDLLPLSRTLYDCCIYKHDSFAEEKEWRIIRHDTTEKFKLGATGIVPYLDFKIPVDAISSICLGPRCDTQKNKFSITEYLKIKGLNNITINNSYVPLH